jgi:hypothetical protein
MIVRHGGIITKRYRQKIGEFEKEKKEATAYNRS